MREENENKTVFFIYMHCIDYKSTLNLFASCNVLFFLDISHILQKQN